MLLSKALTYLLNQSLMTFICDVSESLIREFLKMLFLNER